MESEIDSAGAEEEVAVADREVLLPTAAFVQVFVLALACWMSSIAWVDSSPRLEIISARCRKVGTFFFDAMGQHYAKPAQKKSVRNDENFAKHSEGEGTIWSSVVEINT
jgi:hypothetical protein